MCLNIGTPKKINFSFETNGQLMALGVPILKHFRVEYATCKGVKIFQPITGPESPNMIILF